MFQVYGIIFDQCTKGLVTTTMQMTSSLILLSTPNPFPFWWPTAFCIYGHLFFFVLVCIVFCTLPYINESSAICLSNSFNFAKYPKVYLFCPKGQDFILFPKNSHIMYLQKLFLAPIYIFFCMFKIFVHFLL